MSQKIRIAFMNAAYDLIVEKGYDAVNVTDIANRADYGRSTFYLYFKDKEALFWAMLHHYMAAVDGQIQGRVQHLGSPQREWIAWQTIFRTTETQRAFFLQLEGELSRRLRQVQKDYLIETFSQQLQNGDFDLLLDVPPEVGARFIVGAIIEILEYWLHHPEAGTADEMAAQMFKLVFRQEPPQI